MTSNLTDKELEAKQLMENRFIPLIHHMFKTMSPEKYIQYNGNACRQTAVLGLKIIEELLPDYEWSAWEAEFSDMYMGHPVKYEHAWIYGVNRKEGRRLFLDLAINHKERLFILTPGNRYPKDNPQFSNMVEISRKRLDVDKMLDEEEWYTGMVGHKLLGFVKKVVREGIIDEFNQL